jgi:MscS family membrane protein
MSISSAIRAVRTARPVLWTIALATLCIATLGTAQTPATAPKPDPLGRDNPRSTVTGFLQACSNQDYDQASQYLDLTALSPETRAARGGALAKQLEAILNADSHFSVLMLSRDPQGNRNDDADSNREHIASVTFDGKTLTLSLERTAPAPGGSPVWLFSKDTVTAIPKLAATTTAPAIVKYLPPFFSTVTIAETPLWKWFALIIAVFLLVALSRQFDKLLSFITKVTAERMHASSSVPWVRAVLQPVRVILSLIAFRLAVELIRPAAIARLYIGRTAQALLVCSVAWCLVRLVGLAFSRMESNLDAQHQFASKSMIRLGRRTANATIVILGILLVLSNWGYNTTTLVAGLGVGGIAIALAAQQTIANVFGGVSIIGDHPVRIGEFGKFGDLLGTVEDIGMRSTRIRTLNRTLVSVPNSSFAGYNLENYSLRDKLLFNPIMSIKRATPEDQVRRLVESLRKMLAANEMVESVPTPVRVIALGAASVNVEIFCYVRTCDIAQFYTIQGDLLLAINRELLSANIELA